MTWKWSVIMWLDQEFYQDIISVNRVSSVTVKDTQKSKENRKCSSHTSLNRQNKSCDFFQQSVSVKLFLINVQMQAGTENSSTCNSTLSIVCKNQKRALWIRQMNKYQSLDEFSKRNTVSNMMNYRASHSITVQSCRRVVVWIWRESDLNHCRWHLECCT